MRLSLLLLFFFVFSGLHFFLRLPHIIIPGFFFFCPAVLLGLSLAAEWTAAGFFIFVGLLFLKDSLLLKKLFRLSSIALIFIATVFLTYFTVFQIHFALLPKSGTGDAFMTPAFRQGKLNPFEKFMELNMTSYQTNLIGIKSTHPYSSKWYTWPLMTRPIFYWSGMDEKIYLMGNPALWWGSSLAAVILSFLYFSPITYGLKLNDREYQQRVWFETWR